MKNNFITKMRPYHWFLAGVLVMVIGGYFYMNLGGSPESVDTFAVVEVVSRGTVSSGIKTSGTIIAAEKLDLDVYKQARRIEAVNVTNAEAVAAGTVLVSFDKSGAYVDVQSSRVEIAEAELALSTERSNYNDANPTLRTLESNIITLRNDILKAEQDLVQAKRDYYNANLTAEPAVETSEEKTRPIISGLYTGEATGTYTLTVYRSAADSGFSYNVTGLERMSDNYINGVATPIGNSGLKILLPTTLQHGDTWTVRVPNTDAPEYIVNKETYEETVRELEESIASKRVEIANTEVEIKQTATADGTAYRSLDIEKAEAELAVARQRYSENYDVVQEQDIVAPFAGTVEGMENVVVGATPTGDTNDTISLGTLISNEFLVTFSLSAVDVAKVTVGQKVLVSVTSFPGATPLDAVITQVSSLPESDGVAQYGVQALIATTSSSTFKLREGLLADVEVVEEEVPDVIRVPLSAISYEGAQAKVQVIGDLTETQRNELTNLGVIKSVNGTFPSYFVDVELGVVGTFYAEVVRGLAEGTEIIVTNTEVDSAVIEQDSFGPGEGGPDGEGGGNTADRPSAN